MPRSTKRFITLALVTVSAMLGAGCVPPAPPALRPAPAPAPARSCGSTATTSALLDLVNADRAYAGLRPLAWNGQLACLASDWSAQMASSGTLQHSDLTATLRSPAYASFRTLGENILRGPASLTAAQMHAAWMNSSGHRANILSSAFTTIGIGVTQSGGMLYATESFGG